MGIISPKQSGDIMEPHSYERYVLREKTQDKFFRPKSKSLRWEDEDFCEDIEQAKQYVTRTNAVNQMVALSRSRDIEMVTISVTVKPTSSETITARDIAAREYAPLVMRVEAMSDEEVEALPKSEWKEFVHARNEIRNLDISAADLIAEYKAK